MTFALQVHNLTVAYRRHPAVHHLTGAFIRGSLTAIVGPNGAGKTSLLAAISGQVQPVEGSFSFSGNLQRQIAYLPQQADLDRGFPIRVLDVVMLGHWRRVGAFGKMNAALRNDALEALAAVGLSEFGNRLVGELSAGQFQRVLFARVLLQDAQLILMDEPFNAIDARTTADLLQVVKRWHSEKRTVIAVLHDIEQVREHFPQTLLLAREPVAWGETSLVLSAENLFRARQMAEAWNEDAATCRQGVAA